MSGLDQRTWPDAERDGGDSLLAVPVGATEQHGPHLPLTTDTEIAEALAERLAAVEDCVWVGPALAFGASGEHAGFPGTVSIGAEATELALVELCRSAAASFASVLLISTHGGNAAPLAAAVELLQAEGREVRAWTPRWGGDAHAGRVETSLMLAIAPQRVRLELAEAGNTQPLAELLPRLRAGGVRASAANGVLGDPAGASPEEGEALLAAAVAELRELVAAVAA
jgi:mycofactocin system creatininase family protein